MKTVIEQVSDLIEMLKDKSICVAVAFRNVVGLWNEVCSSYRSDEEEESDGKEFLGIQEPDMRMDRSGSEGVGPDEAKGGKSSDCKRKRNREHEVKPLNNRHQREHELQRNQNKYEQNQQKGREFDGYVHYDSTVRTPSPPKDSDDERAHKRESSGRYDLGEYGDEDDHRKDVGGDIMEGSNGRALQSVLAEEEANENKSKSDEMNVVDEEVSDRGELSDKEDDKSSTDAVKHRRGFENENN